MKHILHPLILSCCVLVSACIPPRVDHRGHMDVMDNFSKLQVGRTSREEVRQLLGSPSITNNFGDEIWYYVSKRKEAVAFLEPDVADQDVTQIVFNRQGVVSEVKRYGIEDAREVAVAEETTPTEGQELGFFEQILGNVGRFNTDSAGRPISSGGGRSPSTNRR